MVNKKGVTDIILAIGIIIGMVVVLFIGANTFSIIVKNEPEFIAKELALTGDAVLAAPEGVLVQYDPPAPKLISGLIFQVRKAILFLGEINFRTGQATGYKYTINVRGLATAVVPIVGIIDLFSYNCDGQQCTSGPDVSTTGSSSQNFNKDKSSSMTLTDYGQAYELLIEKYYVNGAYNILVSGK